jgi:hypothetical protein
MKRDPKLAPVAGDVFRKDYVRREVIYVDAPTIVRCIDTIADRSQKITPTLRQFSRWAAYARIERMAENLGE